MGNLLDLIDHVFTLLDRLLLLSVNLNRCTCRLGSGRESRGDRVLGLARFSWLGIASIIVSSDWLGCRGESGGNRILCLVCLGIWIELAIRRRYAHLNCGDGQLGL